MSPARRRAAVAQACDQLGVSERRACRALGQSRAVQRHAVKVADDEERLTARIVALATQYGRYGYRRITALLRAEGWHVNHKRVERIWRPEGLKVPTRQPKRGRLWLTDGSCIRMRPERPNHVWAYDFVFDRTHDGRALKLLPVVDEYTRECPAIEVGRSLAARDVVRVLASLMVRHGIPEHIRSDNGPEFVATAVRRWLEGLGVGTPFNQPGSPWENGYVESFNGKLRDELLNREPSTRSPNPGCWSGCGVGSTIGPGRTARWADGHPARRRCRGRASRTRQGGARGPANGGGSLRPLAIPAIDACSSERGVSGCQARSEPCPWPLDLSSPWPAWLGWPLPTRPISASC